MGEGGAEGGRGLRKGAVDGGLVAGSAPSWIAASAAMTICLMGEGGPEGARRLRKGAVDGGLGGRRAPWVGAGEDEGPPPLL